MYVCMYSAVCINLRDGRASYQVHALQWRGILRDGNRNNDKSNGPGDGIKACNDYGGRVEWVHRTRLFSDDWLAFPRGLQVQAEV